MKNLFNKKTFVAILFALLSLNLFSQTTASQAKALLAQSDKNTNYSGFDFKADYSIVTQKPGSGVSSTTATMYRRDAKSMFTILITGPEKDKGKGYVQFDKVIWFYDPQDKQFTYTSSKSKFQNTNLNNSDLVPQTLSKNYEIEKFADVKLGSFDCVCFDLKATAKDVDYPIVRLWVSKDDGLIRKKEDYSLSKSLLRTTAIPNYQKIENKFAPVKMLVVDNLRGTKINGKIEYEKTQITISNVSFQNQSNIIYSKKYLEEMSD